MVKIHTTLSVDNELMQKAKEKMFNLSEIFENALKKALNQTEIKIDQTIANCEFCGKVMEKQTKFSANGLVWLYPDEKWICPDCLRKEVSIV